MYCNSLVSYLVKIVGHVVRQHSRRDQNFVKGTFFNLPYIIFSLLERQVCKLVHHTLAFITCSSSLVSRDLGVTWRILPGSHISRNW